MHGTKWAGCAAGTDPLQRTSCAMLIYWFRTSAQLGNCWLIQSIIRKDTADVVVYLLAPSTVPVCMSQVFACVLQGLGKNSSKTSNTRRNANCEPETPGAGQCTSTTTCRTTRLRYSTFVIAALWVIIWKCHIASKGHRPQTVLNSIPLHGTTASGINTRSTGPCKSPSQPNPPCHGGWVEC